MDLSKLKKWILLIAIFICIITIIEALFDFAKENDKIKYFIYLHKNNNNYINYGHIKQR